MGVETNKQVVHTQTKVDAINDEVDTVVASGLRTYNHGTEVRSRHRDRPGVDVGSASRTEDLHRLHYRSKPVGSDILCEDSKKLNPKTSKRKDNT